MFIKFLVGCACAALAVPATASITIFASPGAIQPRENVLFQSDDPMGSLAFGITNQTRTGISFLGTEPLLTPSSGQARVEAADMGLDSLDFFVTAPGNGFRAVEFNIFGTRGTATAVSLSFLDQFNNVFTGNYAIGNGENFFSALATDAQLITRVQIRLNGDVQDIRQFRVDGIANVGIVPEPASWALMITGFGLVGVACRRRRGSVATS